MDMHEERSNGCSSDGGGVMFIEMFKGACILFALGALAVLAAVLP